MNEISDHADIQFIHIRQKEKYIYIFEQSGRSKQSWETSFICNLTRAKYIYLRTSKKYFV